MGPVSFFGGLAAAPQTSPRGRALSDAEFRAEFGCGFRQQSTGNCVFLATLHGVSRLAGFARTLRTRFLRDGATDRVRLPLADPEGRWIDVAAASRRSQFNREFSLFGEAPLFYAPVAGSRGWQSLEAAYILSVFGALDRSLFEADQFRTVAKRLIGGRDLVFSGAGNNALSPLKPHRDKVEALLADFDPSRTVAVAFTRGHALSGRNPDLPAPLKSAHTYAVAGRAGGRTRSLTLADPHDTAAPLTVTMDDFLSYFSGIETATPLLE